MVFGHYTIPIKTLRQQELPAHLREPGVEIQFSVRVVHILFIPFFPFEKLWIMKKGRQSYKMTPQATQFFDNQYGRSRTPWYSFAGILLIVLGFIYMNIQDGIKDRKREASYNAAYTQKANTKLQQLEEATTADYFALKGAGGKSYAAKVDSVMQDSLLLQFVADAPSFSGNSRSQVMKHFVLERLPFSHQTVAKTDLKQTISTDRNDTDFQGTVIAGLANNDPLKVDEIYRMEGKTLSGLSIRDEATTAEVREVINRFLNNFSMDSSLVLIDNASKDYLKEIVNTAQSGEKAMRTYLNETEYPSADYSMLLYAHYSYLETVKKRFPKTDKELLTDFGFFSKLIGLGLWSIDDAIKQANVSNVYVTGKGEAKASLSLRANILETTTQYSKSSLPTSGRPSREMIYFDIKLKRENGAWKVNLPSTWSYTEKQVNKVTASNGFPNAKKGQQEYRIFIQNQLRQLDPTIEIASELIY